VTLSDGSPARDRWVFAMLSTAANIQTFQFHKPLTSQWWLPKTLVNAKSKTDATGMATFAALSFSELGRSLASALTRVLCRV
jgi:hypothetical protein